MDEENTPDIVTILQLSLALSVMVEPSGARTAHPCSLLPVMLYCSSPISTTVSNIGIILGALIASALSGKIRKVATVNKKLVYAAIIGGFLMGYGARLAFGCNIGALFGGIASGSVHGWVWFLFAFIVYYFGVKSRKFFY